MNLLYRIWDPYLLRHGIILPILLIISVTLLGTRTVSGQKPFLKFQSAHFTVADGLSSGQIYNIHQDKFGFVWITTANGLNRFDGKNFKSYFQTPVSPGKITDNRFYDIVEDYGGNLWLSTISGGLSHFNTSTGVFTQIEMSRYVEQIINPFILDLSYSTDTVLNFTGRGSKFLFRYSQLTDKLTRYALPLADSTEYVLNSQVYSDSIIVVSTNHKRLLFFSLRSKSFLPETVSLQSEAIHMFKQGHRLWYSMRHKEAGCYNLQEKREYLDTKRFGTKYQEISSFSFDQETGLFLLGGAKGLLMLAREPFTDGDIFVLDSELVKSASINEVFHASDGTILVGTRGVGLFVLRKQFNYFKTLSLARGDINVQSIRSIATYGRNIFIGGYNGLDVYDKETGRTVRIDGISNVAYSLALDPEKPETYLWCGGETFSKLLGKINYQTGDIEFFSFDFNKAIVHTLYSIVPGEYGELWLGFDNRLIKFYPSNKTWKSFVPLIGEQAIQIRHIQKFSNNLLALSLGSGGLKFFDTKEEKFFNHTEVLGVSLDGISVLSTLFKEGFLWVATNGLGLYRIDVLNKKIVHITESDGLPNNVVYGVLADDDGRYWISTNNGIAVYRPGRGEFRHFTVSDGLQDNEFNAGALYRSPEGILFFGGINGLNFLRPEVIREKPHPLPVYLTGVRFINSGKVLSYPNELTKELTFNHTDLPVVLQFSGISLGNANEVHYYIKMNDTIGNWKTLGETNEMMLTNMEGGTYMLFVKAVNHSGEWESTVMELTIIVIPPFYKTWWFVTLSIILIGSFIALLFWHRLHTIKKINMGLEIAVTQRTHDVELSKLEVERQKTDLEELNKELVELNKTKDTFFSIIAHDLRSPFTTLLGSLRVLNEDYDEMPDDERKQFLRGSESLASSTFDLLENLLQWSQIERGKLPFLPHQFYPAVILRKIAMLQSPILKKKEIRLRIEVPGDMELVTDENIFYFVLRNLISNGIKFTASGGEITVSVTKTSEQIHFHVSDTGIGMDAETIDKLLHTTDHYTTKGTAQEAGTGLGFRLCLSMMKLALGNLSVSSEKGIGSVFTVSFPLK